MLLPTSINEFNATVYILYMLTSCIRLPTSDTTLFVCLRMTTTEQTEDVLISIVLNYRKLKECKQYTTKCQEMQNLNFLACKKRALIHVASNNPFSVRIRVHPTFIWICHESKRIKICLVIAENIITEKTVDWSIMTWQNLPYII